MKFNELVEDILLEQRLTAELVDQMYEKWSNERKQELPELTKEATEELIKKFIAKKETLAAYKQVIITQTEDGGTIEKDVPDGTKAKELRGKQTATRIKSLHPGMRSFLNRFDGNHGHDKFDVKDIQVIPKYTYEQILYLIDELYPSEGEIESEIFTPNNKNKELKIQKSKEEWYSENATFTNGSLRMYYIPDQQSAIKYGYYLKFITTLNGDYYSQWCVTLEDPSQNRWGTYRNNKTFYFVIDDSKPTHHLNHLTALQFNSTANPATPYHLTNMQNNGQDEIMGERQLLELFPLLQGGLHLIKPVKYQPDDELMRNKDVVDRINERVGDQYEFRRMPRKYKAEYVRRGATIESPDSWDAMDDILRANYIGATVEADLFTRFNNYKFLTKVAEKNADRKYLDKRCKMLGYADGILVLYKKVLKDGFFVARTSIDNPKLVVYQDKVHNEYGIFNIETAEWHKHNGITYGLSYVEVSDMVGAYIDENYNAYAIEAYSIGGTLNDESFYVVIPANANNKRGEAHFISAAKWKALIGSGKLKPEDEEFVGFDAADDVDIREQMRMAALGKR
jgi:hypothetical protein